MSMKAFATSCELMDYLIESGLSYHYLPFFLDQASLNYDYIDRFIAS